MAIEMISSNILSRTGEAKPATKLSEADIERVKSEVKDIKNTDLLQISARSAENLGYEPPRAAFGFQSEIAPELFSSELPKADTDGNYSVGGVKFSRNELEQSKNVIKSAINGLAVGTLDYKDYAKMGLAISSVSTYAKNNLNEEQGQILKNAILEYTDYLTSEQDKMLSDGSFVMGNRGELSSYYGMEKIVDDTGLKAINDLIDEMNRVSGGNKPHVSAGFTTVTQSATNKNLISQITDLFSDLDLNNSSALNGAVSKYKSLITPALLANGTKNEKVSQVADKQAADLVAQINGVFSQYNKLNIKS